MTILRVRVNKYLQSEDGPPPKVYARITRMDERGRSVPSSSRLELVPITTHDAESEAITLDSGAYLVEVRMPTGELLADSVSLDDGGDKDLVLMAESSPHEWLSWQHLAGNVGTRSAQFSRPRSPRIVKAAPVLPSAPSKLRTRRLLGTTGSVPRSRDARSGPPATDGPIDWLGRIGLGEVDGVVGVRDAFADPETWSPDEPADVEPSRPIHWLGRGAGASHPDFLREQPWHALAALQGGTANLVAGLNAGRPDRLIAPSGSDPSVAVFRIPNEPGRQRGNYSPAVRDFAAVHRRTGVELVSLPTPWRETWSGRDAVIEVGVRCPRYESEFASSIVVRDQTLAVLLGFLSSGALTAVTRLAETGNVMLFEKNENPLAAAAGGYALVGSATDATRQPWHDWIENLMNRFEHLPDGAILFATMRLRLRSNATDVREAAQAFKVAYRRGLPFYGLGMRWLLDGLERVGEVDPEAKDMATAVRRLASRLHPQSPFTILRLGKR